MCSELSTHVAWNNKNDRIRGHELRGMGVGKLYLLKHKVSLQIGAWEKMEREGGGRNYVNTVAI